MRPITRTASGLTSLWELMERYDLSDLTLMLGGLISASTELTFADVLNKKITDVRGEEYFPRLAVALDGLAIMCERFEPDSSLLKQIRDLEGELKNGNGDKREAVVQVRLQAILDGIQNNLELRAFMFVSAERVSYYENNLLFGKEFLESFSEEAVVDMVQAGNCYAANLPTACVFHCMRVAEYGLRKLARKVRAKITHKGKPYPIEYGTWDKVIVAIKGKILTARQLPQGPVRQQRLKFYSLAADHCEYMKDIWRNEVSHTRRQYKQPEALAALTRVKEFSQLLATSK
jgi:hypothetical protein